MHLQNPQATVWYCKDYMAKRNGMYTNDELIEKAFQVNDWMNCNPDNEWVQHCGQQIITGLNGLLYEGYNTLMYDDETEVMFVIGVLEKEVDYAKSCLQTT